MVAAAVGATGKIVQVLGPVVDVEFPSEHLPEIYNAVEITHEDGSVLVLEVQSHLGNDWVRAVAMSSTDGLRRGMDVVDTGKAIEVPVGRETLGRILNVVGEPIDQPRFAEVVVDRQHPVVGQAVADIRKRLLREHVALEAHA